MRPLAALLQHSSVNEPSHAWRLVALALAIALAAFASEPVRDLVLAQSGFFDTLDQRPALSHEARAFEATSPDLRAHAGAAARPACSAAPPARSLACRRQDAPPAREALRPDSTGPPPG